MKNIQLTLAEAIDNLIKQWESTPSASSDHVVMHSKVLIEFDLTKLTLADFIACDKDGKPFEKPNENDDYYRDANGISENYFEDMKEYQQALDRVVYEGWSLDNQTCS
jgi:hypothetical protein